MYLSPPLDPMQGLPLGNGDLGALVWCEPRKLCLAVNKCDLWEDSPDEAFGYYNDPDGHHTEEMTTLRHGCRLEIELGLPLLDAWYLKDFEARLDLARGMAVIRAATPFGAFHARILVSADARSLVVKCGLDGGDDSFAPRVTVERWGSRMSQMWYALYDRDPSRGLAGTRTEADGGDLLIRQQLRKLDFTVAASVEDNGAAVAPQVSHARGGVFEPERQTRHELTVLLTIANSEEVGDSRRAAVETLAAARHTGAATLAAAHVEDWRKFWERTHLRTHNDLVDNIWHLAIYYAASSQRGRYPGLFTQSLWFWNRDFQPWNHYFHWNQQQLTWPLCASGHPELLRAYLDFRAAQLPMALAVARKHGKPGAFYGDKSDRIGHMGYEPNRTPGGQIVADFWRAYLYDGDLDYLRDKGWPLIREVARWHMGMLERKDDGLYHTTPGWGYEGGNTLRDCTSELVTTRRGLEVALACAERFGHDDAETTQWRTALDHLAPLPTMESPVNSGVTIFAAGYQKGIEKRAGEALCGGFPEGDAEEWAEPRATCAHDPKRWAQIFSDVETSPIFPDGRIGLGDRGTPTFELALATAREADMHWTKRIVLARLGMTRELWEDLDNPGNNWSCTGITVDDKGYWTTKLVADPALNPKDYSHKDYNSHPDWEPFKKSRSPLRMFEFRRFGMERTYLVATAVGEAVLQSHDGVIRVANALPPDAPFAFTLMAAGGFFVSAEGVGAHPAWIHIEATRGGRCTVANPWGKPAWLWDLAAGAHREVTDGMAVFDTLAGGRYLLSPERIHAKDWDCQPAEVEPNAGPKTNGSALTLGLPRSF
ncbi:MAG: hypothetical protein PHR35_06430 [Kiritimatiellae bacterium]|nr:hypothetical protein [Kiritimatiellia bacterium]